MEVSHSYHNRLSDPLTEAVFWSEYIAENGGNLLRSKAAVQLNFFNYHSFDVILLLLLTIFVTIFLLIKTITMLWMRMKGSSGDSISNGRATLATAKKSN